MSVVQDGDQGRQSAGTQCASFGRHTAAATEAVNAPRE